MEFLANPAAHAWNYVLHYVQFTQEQLLEVRDYVDLVAMVKYQKCVTMDFLRTHFRDEINACLELDWDWIHAYLTGTLVPVQYRTSL